MTTKTSLAADGTGGTNQLATLLDELEQRTGTRARALIECRFF